MFGGSFSVWWLIPTPVSTRLVVEHEYQAIDAKVRDRLLLPNEDSSASTFPN